MGNGEKKWRRFEDLVAQIQRDLAPSANVEQNVKMLGRRSGSMRQLDVIVRNKVGQYELLIVIECKDHKRAVDVKAIEEFMGLARDVGANKGVIVAPNGFTAAARTRAQDVGIDLYKLVDAKSRDWRSELAIPVVVDVTMLEHFSLSFTIKSNVSIPAQDLRMLILRRETGEVIAPIQNLIADNWNAGRFPHDPGEHHGLPISDEPTFLRDDEGRLGELEVRANLCVSRTLYFGELEVAETQGFLDELRGGLITRELTTGPIEFAKVLQEWQPIESLDELAVAPVFRMETASVVPKIRPSDEAH